MEPIGIGHFLVILMRHQADDFPDICHLLLSNALRSIRVIHSIEDQEQIVVVLLYKLAQELSSSPQITLQIQRVHVLLILLELVLDQIKILEQLHLASLVYGDSLDDLLSQLVPKRAINLIRLVGIHGLIHLCIVQVFIIGEATIVGILPEGHT